MWRSSCTSANYFGEARINCMYVLRLVVQTLRTLRFKVSWSSCGVPIKSGHTILPPILHKRTQLPSTIWLWVPASVWVNLWIEPFRALPCQSPVCKYTIVFLTVWEIVIFPYNGSQMGQLLVSHFLIDFILYIIFAAVPCIVFFFSFLCAIPPWSPNLTFALPITSPLLLSL